MNWKTVPAADKEAAVKRIVGKTITSVSILATDGAIKDIVFDLGEEKLRISIDCYSFQISLPKQSYILNGSVKLGSLRAVIDPEEFDTEQKAKDRMKELLEENDTFEGVVTVVVGV